MTGELAVLAVLGNDQDSAAPENDKGSGADPEQSPVIWQAGPTLCDQG